MKISIAITILILAAAAFFGYSGHTQLEGVRESHAKLSKRAAALGVAIGSEGDEGGVLVTKRGRKDRDAEAKLAAEDFIAFALELESFRKDGGRPDEAMQERISVFMERMLSLDAGQLKILIAEFRDSKELEGEIRTGMIAFAIMTLANDHPEAALNLFIASEDLLEDGMSGKHVLSSSLANWASRDPDGALEWVRKNGETHPDLITDAVKAGLVKGAGTNNMALGFNLLQELKMEDPGDAIRALGRVADTAAKRVEFLSLFRKFEKADLTAYDRDVSGDLNAISDGIVKDGFEVGSRWITDNALSPEEMDSLSKSVLNSAKSGEKGQWIEWMGENLSKDRSGDRISDIMRSWTRTDYRAAGEWLAGTPEGDTRNSAVKSYAETVAKYDPKTATQWALTLPEGDMRTQSLQDIHRMWPTDTPEQKNEKAAFKEEYGIR